VPFQLARLRPHDDDRARLEAELRRHIAVHHMHRIDGRRARWQAKQPIETFVYRYAVLDVQQAIVGAANVEKAVVLSRPPREAREGGLYALAGDWLGDTAHSVSRQRVRVFRSVLAGISVDDDIFSQCGPSSQRELDRQSAADDERLCKELRIAGGHTHRVGARRNVGEAEGAVDAARCASDLGAEGIGDHDLGGRYRLPGRVTDDAVYASDLKLGCSRSRDQDNEERCNLFEDHKPA